MFLIQFATLKRNYLCNFHTASNFSFFHFLLVPLLTLAHTGDATMSSACEPLEAMGYMVVVSVPS